MHVKVLQRQISVATLVNSQQRKALPVPVINRGSTGRLVPSTVYMGFPLFVLAKRRSEQLFTLRWGARRAVGVQGDRNVGSLFCQASPRPAVRLAPCRTEPPVVCPGFGLDRCSPSTSVLIRKTSALCVVLCFTCFSCALIFFPEVIASALARQRLKLSRRLPTMRSKLSFQLLSTCSPGRWHLTLYAALAQEKCGQTGGLPICVPTRFDAP